MQRFFCPYLDAEIELSEERSNHIAEHHPDLLPSHFRTIAETLENPDLVRRSARAGNARLFSKWYNEIKGGQHVVVVVISGQDTLKKHWIITAYFARKLSEGEIEWKKN